MITRKLLTLFVGRDVTDQEMLDLEITNKPTLEKGKYVGCSRTEMYVRTWPFKDKAKPLYSTLMTFYDTNKIGIEDEYTVDKLIREEEKLYIKQQAINSLISKGKLDVDGKLKK